MPEAKKLIDSQPLDAFVKNDHYKLDELPAARNVPLQREADINDVNEVRTTPFDELAVEADNESNELVAETDDDSDNWEFPSVPSTPGLMGNHPLEHALSPATNETLDSTRLVRLHDLPPNESTSQATTPSQETLDSRDSNLQQALIPHLSIGGISRNVSPVTTTEQKDFITRGASPDAAAGPGTVINNSRSSATIFDSESDEEQDNNKSRSSTPALPKYLPTNKNKVYPTAFRPYTPSKAKPIGEESKIDESKEEEAAHVETRNNTQSPQQGSIPIRRNTPLSPKVSPAASPLAVID
jgi:hypothetical protein